MAAFFVLSTFLVISNQKNHHFYIDFYTSKICGNNFITTFVVPVKIYVKVLVI